MSIQTWSGLQKSATDSETIEQAIARLIAVHDSDPSSHLGVDGSLLAHKSDEVIDHPAGSVLADKLSVSEFQIADSFDSIDAWTSVAGTQQNVGYALQVNKLASGNYLAQSYANIPFFDVSGFPSKSMIFQFVARPFLSSGTPFFAVAVASYWDSPTDGFGLKIESDGVTLYIDANGSRTSASKYSFTATGYHTYRIEMNVPDQKAYLYVDGVQVSSLAYPSTFSGNGDSDFNISVSQATSPSASLRLTQLFYSQSVN